MGLRLLCLPHVSVDSSRLGAARPPLLFAALLYGAAGVALGQGDATPFATRTSSSSSSASVCAGDDEALANKSTSAGTSAEDAGNSALWTLHEYLVTQETVPLQGLSLGAGWNRALSQQLAARCVIGQAIDVEGGSVDVKFYDTFDREQVISALNVSASASYMSVSGSANFSRTVTIDRNLRNILGVVNVDKGGKQLTAPVLKEDSTASDSRVRLTEYAKQLLCNPKQKQAVKRLADFQRHCGDAYVGTIRKGGQLAVMFNSMLTNESLKQSFSASASGGSSGFSGSGSLSQSLSKEVSQGSTRVNTTQKGGVLVTEFEADKVLEKIKNFAAFDDEKQSVPAVAVLVPYKTLPGWPRELLNIGPTDVQLRELAGQGDRLTALARLYGDAATNPTRFYFPFVDKTLAADTKKCSDPVKEQPCIAGRVSTSLYTAAACVKMLAAKCMMDVACNINALSDLASARTVCPFLADKLLDEDEQVVAHALLLSSAALRKANGLPELKIQGRDKSAAQSPANAADDNQTFLKKVLERRTYKTNNGQRISESESNMTVSVYDMYYRYLAAAPLVKIGSDDPRDEAFQVWLFCTEVGGRNCELVKRTTLATVAAPENPAAETGAGTNVQKNPTTAKAEADHAVRMEVYRGWVLARRLAPRALAFCDLSAMHPMCKEPPALMAWAEQLQPDFGRKRNYTTDATASVAPSTPPKGTYIDHCYHPRFRPECF